MTGIPMLQGWWDQLKQPLSEISQGVGNIINPNFQVQTLLKKQLMEDPTLRQKLVDAEAQNPGTIERMFGKQAFFLGQGTPSIQAQGAIYARDNAGKPLEQWDNTARSQVEQQALGVGTQLDRDVKKQTLDFYTAKKKESDLAFEQAQAIWKATKDLAGPEARATMEQNLTAATKRKNDVALAEQTVKTYGGDRNKILDNLAKSLAGGKVDQKDLVPFEAQIAMQNTDPGFQSQLEMRYRKYMNDAEFQNQKYIHGLGRADAIDMLARQQANNFMQISGNFGMNLDPNKLYNVFKVGFDKAKTDANLKDTVDQIGKASEAQSMMMQRSLQKDVFSAMEKLNMDMNAAQRLKDPVAKNQLVQNAVTAYNTATRAAQSFSDFTGKDLGIPEMNLKQYQTGGLFGWLSKDNQIVSYRKPTPAADPAIVKQAVDQLRANPTLLPAFKSNAQIPQPIKDEVLKQLGKGG